MVVRREKRFDTRAGDTATFLFNVPLRMRGREEHPTVDLDRGDNDMHLWYILICISTVTGVAVWRPRTKLRCGNGSPVTTRSTPYPLPGQYTTPNIFQRTCRITRLVVAQWGKYRRLIVSREREFKFSNWVSLLLLRETRALGRDAHDSIPRRKFWGNDPSEVFGRTREARIRTI